MNIIYLPCQGAKSFKKTKYSMIWYIIDQLLSSIHKDLDEKIANFHFFKEKINFIKVRYWNYLLELSTKAGKGGPYLV